MSLTMKVPDWQHLPISIDVETMGLANDAPVFAIGAVRFTEDGSPLPEGCPGEFYRLINLRGQAPMDVGTLHWWLNQSPEARNELKRSDNAQPAARVLMEFRDWLMPGYSATTYGNYFEGEVWVRGDRDSTWIEHLCKKVVGCELPYRYHKVRDQRTLIDFAQHHLGIDDLWAPRETPMHHALHDAIYQAECIQKVLKRYPSME